MRAALIAVSALSLSLLSRPVMAQGQGAAFMGPSARNLQATVALRPVALSSESAASVAPEATVVVAPGSGKRTGRILMIAGAAAFVTGLIIDEEAVWIPGAIAAGVGAVLYFK